MTWPRLTSIVGHPSASTASSSVARFTPHVVGANDPVGPHGLDQLRIEGLEHGTVCRHRDRPVDREFGDVESLRGRRIRDRLLLELDHDHEREVVGVRIGPCRELPEADLERQAVRLEVEILGVEHLEAGLVEFHASGFGGKTDQGHRLPRGIETPVGVGEHVDLELANAEVLQLLGEGTVRVVDRLGQLRAQRLDRCVRLGPGPEVIRVVRPEDLQVVDPQRVRRLGGRSRGRRGRRDVDGVAMVDVGVDVDVDVVAMVDVACVSPPSSPHAPTTRANTSASAVDRARAERMGREATPRSGAAQV